MIEHHQEHDLMLTAMLDEQDRIFDRETDRLLRQADEVLEVLRLESIRLKSYRDRGRPKAAA